MQEFLRFAPLPQERVWGGRALETTLGRALPPGGRPFGESWEIVDRPEAQSVVVGGRFAGLTLRELMEQHSAAIMGPRWPAGKPFPILVKWLDCHERLSLQVHPPAAIAASLGGEPKTENWFVAAAAPGAHLIVGLKPGVTRAQFEAAVAAGRAEDCVNRFPVAAGDSVLVRSGTVHAIDGGNLILEIQQNSDTTYRVDDWGRVGLDGKPRQLHLAESLQSILWDAKPPGIPRQHRYAQFWLADFGALMLANVAEFSIRRISMPTGKILCSGYGRWRLDAHPLGSRRPRILSVVEGRLTSASGEVGRGENILLAYAGQYSFTAMENSVVLVTDDFTRSPAGRLWFQFKCVVFMGRRDDYELDDRALLHMSTVALALSITGWLGRHFSWPDVVVLFAWGGAALSNPTCLVISIWKMLRPRCTRRIKLAAIMAALGTLIGWSWLMIGLVS